MKNCYETATMEIVALEEQDVIVTSNPEGMTDGGTFPGGGGGETPW